MVTELRFRQQTDGKVALDGYTAKDQAAGFVLGEVITSLICSACFRNKHRVSDIASTQHPCDTADYVTFTKGVFMQRGGQVYSSLSSPCAALNATISVDTNFVFPRLD
jgi:hypothetical protein